MINDEDFNGPEELGEDFDDLQSDDASDEDLISEPAASTKFKPGQSGNLKGRPKGTKKRGFGAVITDEDRAYYATDSRRFLERALLRAHTWEDGLKIARELRALQHASLQAIQTKTDTTHTITLRWSTPAELPSNQQSEMLAIEGEVVPDGKGQ